MTTDKSSTDSTVADANETTAVTVESSANEKKMDTTSEAADQNQKETVAQKNVSNKDAESKNKADKKPARWPVIVLLLLMICALGAIGYFLWLQDKKISYIAANEDSQSKTYDIKVDTLQENVSAINNEINSQLNQQKQNIEKLTKENQQLKQQISGQREQWAALTTTTNEDWKLAEAHYLTRLAGQRLVMERNTQGALALLQASDEILQKLTDPELFQVREKLAEDITALKLVSSVDREGIFLSLAAMSKALNVLPSPIPQNYEKISSVDEVLQEEDKSQKATGFEVVKQSFAKALSAFQNYIRITQHDETLQSLLPADGQAYLQNSLRLTLETAQLALLKEQQLVFEESLDKASRLLSEYYPFSKEAESLVSDLNSLKELNIIQVLPDITQSQKILGSYIEKLHRLKTFDKPQAVLSPNKNSASKDEAGVAE